MNLYRVEVRGYWKVRNVDLENASLEIYKGIVFPIDGSGSSWSMGKGEVVILKGSTEWEYLVNHISKLDSFLNKGENTNSKSIPNAFLNCFKRESI